MGHPYRVGQPVNGAAETTRCGIGGAADRAWSGLAQSAVLVMTVGRTARVNGTRGTDHGTATVAFALGGAVAGGRIRAAWPGLTPGQLLENRDLAPTTDLRAVARGLLAQHFGLDPARVGTHLPWQRWSRSDSRVDPDLMSPTSD